MAVEYLCTISFLIPERLTPGKNIAFLQSASGIITSPAVLSMSITILFAILTPFTNGSCSNAEPANESGSISSVNPSAIELPSIPKDTQITQSTFIFEKYNKYICKHIYTMYPFPEARL